MISFWILAHFLLIFSVCTHLAFGAREYKKGRNDGYMKGHKDGYKLGWGACEDFQEEAANARERLWFAELRSGND